MYSTYLYSLFIYLDFFPYWCLSDSLGVLNPLRVQVLNKTHQRDHKKDRPLKKIS